MTTTHTFSIISERNGLLSHESGLDFYVESFGVGCAYAVLSMRSAGAYWPARQTSQANARSPVHLLLSFDDCVCSGTCLVIPRCAYLTGYLYCIECSLCYCAWIALRPILCEKGTKRYFSIRRVDDKLRNLYVKNDKLLD